MSRIIVDKQIIVIALGIFTAVGILSKCMVNAILSRLVRAAGNMSKSTHPLMRLVRAKFEHACMVSEKVENVEVFVDKYLYSYKVLGIPLHSLRRLEKAAALLCIVTGFFGAVLTYSVYGMNDLVLQTGVIGAGLGILVYVFHLTTDENYRMQMARNFMVDYLQNVCLHRYEKAHQKEMDEKRNAEWEEDEEEQEITGFEEDEFEEADVAVKADVVTKTDTAVRTDSVMKGRAVMKMDNAAKAAEPIRPKPGREVPSPQTPPEILPPSMPEPYPAPGTMKGEDKGSRVKAAYGKEEKEELEGTEQKSVEKEILIRQILEEFMA